MKLNALLLNVPTPSRSHRTMPSSAGYTRLPSTPVTVLPNSDYTGSVEAFEYEDPSGRSTQARLRNSCGIGAETAGWKFFIWSCVAVLVLSTLNLTLLSTLTTLELARGTLSRPTGLTELKRPSVYLGHQWIVKCISIS